MAERDENVEEIIRDRKEESLAEIKDNQIETVNEKNNEELKQKIMIIKNTIENLELGYKCEFDNEENPTSLLIYGKDDQFITCYNENGLQKDVSIQAENLARQLVSYKGELNNEKMNKLIAGVKVKEEGKKALAGESEKIQLTEEERARLRGKVETAMLSDEEKLALQGKIEKGELTEEEKEKIEGNVKKEKTKEEFQKELGEDYIVAAEINDEEISRKLITIGNFSGNPYMAYNKKTNEFTIVGNKGDGKLSEVKLLSIPAKCADEYSPKGDIIKKRQLAGKSSLLLPPDYVEGLNVGMSEYGEVKITKLTDARDPSSPAIPVDTKQTYPTTQEISDMKKDGKGLKELYDIIDEMQAENIISGNEADRKKVEMAHDNRSIDENIEDLKKIKKNEKSKKTGKEEKEDDELEGYAEWDPNYRSEMRLNREREIKN